MVGSGINGQVADIVVSEFMDTNAIAELSASYTVLYEPDLVDRPEDLLNAVSCCRALIVRNRTQVRGDLLAAATKLRVVGRLGVGLDNIDTLACYKRKILVMPANGANALAVAEYVIVTAMALRRCIHQATNRILAGQWPREAMAGGRELSGATLGLLGFGSIARLTADRARLLGMRVIAHDPFVAPSDPAWSQSGLAGVGFEELLSSADVLSIHVPLSDQTRGRIDAQAIGLMRPDAVLINSSRGGIVDEAALAAALRAGRLGGAALDVLAEEPPTLTSASIFHDCPNLILTPHIAGVTAESNVRVSAVTAANVLRELRRNQ